MFRLASQAGNRMEAYGLMRLDDFFSRVSNVPFKKVKVILEANRNPEDKRLDEADHEAQKLKIQEKERSAENNWWSCIEIPYHKTGHKYSLWVLVSPVDCVILYAYEHACYKFLTEILGWGQDQAEDRDKPLLMNTNGGSLIGNHGLDTKPFSDATGCSYFTGQAFRTMMSNHSISHELMAVKEGER